MIGLQVSHYRITGKLGAGGMGVVYEALDTKLHRTVALKFLPPESTRDPEAKARFIQEARAASALDHPNICVIHEIGETEDGQLFIAMARYRGETLKRRIGREPLTPQESLDIAFQVAAGLAEAHRREIVHRDVKPANIFLTEDGLVKILDFGLAKLADHTLQTRQGSTPGTISYMSPEQAQCQTTDYRTDIWSLGVVIYEMVTGRRPFTADFDQAVLYAIINREATPAHEVVPGIPPGLSEIVARCMKRVPDQRFADVGELMGAMTGLVAAEGWRVPHAGLEAIPETSPPASRSLGVRWKVAAAVVALLAVIAAVRTWVLKPSPYSTDVRMAVMPLENRGKPGRQAETVGLTEVVSRMMDQAARDHPSMWVVPNRLVAYAELVRPAQARGALGVNRLVTGGPQVFREGEMLLLELRDAASLERLRSVQVPLEPPGAFVDSLTGALIRLADLPPGTAPRLRRYLPASGEAAFDYLRGLGLLDGKDHAGALAALSRVTEAEPGFCAGWCDRGLAAWRAFGATARDSFFDQALGWLDEAAGCDPAAWRPPFHRGVALRLTGDLDGALAAFARADSLDPGNAWICQRMSYVYRDRDMVEEGSRLLRTAVARHPDYFEAHRINGKFHYFTEDPDEGLKYLLETLELAPDDAEALNTVGAILAEKGEYERMRWYLERAFALHPDCNTSSNIGYSFFQQGRFGEAASFYELAADFCDSTDSDPWASWGRSLYWAEGGRTEAIVKLERAVAMIEPRWREAPDDLELISELIDLHAMSGHEEAARRLIAFADSLGLEDDNLLYRITCAFELMGDRNAALRRVREAVRHGTALERIRSTPELVDLVADPRFSRLVGEVRDGDSRP